MTHEEIKKINERISKFFKPISIGTENVKSSSAMTEEEWCLKLWLEAINYDKEMVELVLADTREAAHYRNKITEMGIAYLALKARGK